MSRYNNTILNGLKYTVFNYPENSTCKESHKCQKGGCKSKCGKYVLSNAVKSTGKLNNNT